MWKDRNSTCEYPSSLNALLEGNPTIVDVKLSEMGLRNSWDGFDLPNTCGRQNFDLMFFIKCFKII